MFLSSCVHGGGVGHSLVTYLHHEKGLIEPHVVMPEPGVMAKRLPRSAHVHYVPEFVERVQRGPYAWTNSRDWPWLQLTGGVAAMFHACASVTQLARQVQPDVIYCNHMIAKPIGAYAGRQTGIPVVFHARNVHVHPVGRRFYRWIAGFETTRLVIANSEASAGPYRGAGAEVVVVPNAVDLSRFDPGTVTPQLRRELGLGEDRRIIGYFGRLVPKKGVNVLIEAFARIHREHPKAVLALIGGNDSGQYEDWDARYRALAKQLGVEGKVHFVGFRDVVAPYMADLDINVLPSVEPESFGRVLIEAMPFGVPGVVAAHGGAMEVIRDGVNGFHAKPGDVDDLARQLSRLLGDQPLRARMGAFAKDEVRARYDAAQVSAQITELLHRVAGRELNASRLAA
jgi:glycosyltransferase involved in cell wall biosynthesis